MGFRETALAAQPELLEPIMSLDIVTPPEYVGDIMGDINSRRGQVCDMDMKGDLQNVRARVPLAELFGYATAIRSLSRGRASYTMETGGKNSRKPRSTQPKIFSNSRLLPYFLTFLCRSIHIALQLLEGQLLRVRLTKRFQCRQLADRA